MHESLKINQHNDGLTDKDGDNMPALDDLDAQFDKARSALLALQNPDGHWCFPLEADCTIPAEYILMMHFMDEVDVELPSATDCTSASELGSIVGTGPKGELLAAASVQGVSDACAPQDRRAQVRTFAGQSSQPSALEPGQTYTVGLEVVPFTTRLTVKQTETNVDPELTESVMGANLLSSLDPEVRLGGPSALNGTKYSNVRVWADIGTPDSGMGGSTGVGGTSGAGGSSSGGSGGAAGSGGVAGTSGAGGSSSGGSGGSGDGPLNCTSGSETFDFVVSNAAAVKQVPLPVEVGRNYRRLSMSFQYTPLDWGAPCYNPATSKKTGFPRFNHLVTLQRGTPFCKGGNLFGITLQGPGPGHGANNKVLGQTFYKSAYHTGSGCGGSDIEADIFNQTHGLSLGQTYTATVTWDRDAGTMTADVGNGSITGPIAPGVELQQNPGEPAWHITHGFPGGYLECKDNMGNDDPTAPCCFGPNVGWQYSDLTWELCY